MSPRSTRYPGHHAVFDAFTPYDGPSPAGVSLGFLGDRFRASFGGWEPQPEGYAALTAPPIDEEYFEWIDILEAALLAGPTFTFLELGAGFGRWSVRAALAARQLGKTPRLVLAEADPRHVSFIHTNMADNGVPPDEYRVFDTAVAGSREDKIFCVGTPTEGDAWYGQSVIGDDVGDSPVMGEYFGRPLYSYQGGWAHVIRLKQIPLSSVLEGEALIDLVDLDLQGAEALAVAEAIGPLTAKVRRLHIGTHGTEIEAQLRAILSQAGWTCLRDYRLGEVNETEFGACDFNDGVQSWVNPALR